MIEHVLSSRAFITVLGAKVCASTYMEAQACLKQSSFLEMLRDIEQHRCLSRARITFGT
jgi:hypothetical protein